MLVEKTVICMTGAGKRTGGKKNDGGFAAEKTPENSRLSAVEPKRMLIRYKKSLLDDLVDPFWKHGWAPFYEIFIT